MLSLLIYAIICIFYLFFCRSFILHFLGTVPDPIVKIGNEVDNFYLYTYDRINFCSPGDRHHFTIENTRNISYNIIRYNSLRTGILLKFNFQKRGIAMESTPLKNRLKEKADIDTLVQEVINEPSMIAELIDIINTDKSSVKFLCTKIIRLVSEKNPHIVYDYFDEVVKFIYSRNSFVKWDGVTILSNLAIIDSEGKFDSICEKYFDLIRDPQMITAGNVVGNAWKIAINKPQYESYITRCMLSVPDIIYYNKGKPSTECNNVLCGHVIDCFEKYYLVSNNKPEILLFIRGQLKNSRKPVVKKAERFLKKYS